jgi:2-oxoglutarate dehydrogenase E2 component (dihydrolipoamide succinyltransferase)
VLAYLETSQAKTQAESATPVTPTGPAVVPSVPEKPSIPPLPPDKRGRLEQRVPMTRLRTRIAERLVEAQHTAAMLTTFNEVNMQPIMDLRARYRDKFEKSHGVRLGIMSFFVKAVIESLKRFPAVNGSIDGNDIIYHGYYDIGIAVSSPRGLVVPILRDADQMSFADIEKTITDFGKRAQEGSLSMEELTGGTFSITNGGVFGSLMSTPILNPPQSGILGMHKVMDRAMVEHGQVVVRPMMYLALTYDHRIIDGREAVSSLVAIKECLEDPARLLLQI